MKKIVLSVAVLSAALAQAQVGINKETPKATLDISVKKENIDNESQEGLLIPRVTKEKALKMANNSTTPEESVLIYVNDVLGFTSPADDKVNDITEKGYYFWNGTKWVKTAGENGQEWVYNPVNKRIELKRSGQGDFTNDVYYNENGSYISIDKPNVQAPSFNGQTLSEAVDPIPHGASRSYVEVKTSSLKLPSNIAPDIWGGIYGGSKTHSTYFDEMPDRVTGYNASSIGSYVSSGLSSLKDIKSLSSTFSNISYHAPFKLEQLVGDYSGVTVGVDSSVDYVYAKRNQAKTYSNQNMGSVRALENYNYIRGNGVIDNAIGSTDWVVFQNQSTATVKRLVGHSVVLRAWQQSDPTLNDVMGVLISGFVNNTAKQETIPTNIGSYKGLVISNIEGATTNYSIYTGKGNIRFGDLAKASATADRVVTVDNDGVLKTEDATAFANANNEWVYDENKQIVKLKRGGQGDFHNEVYYDKEGGFNSVDKPNEDMASFDGSAGPNGPTGAGAGVEVIDTVPHGKSKNSVVVKTSTVKMPSNVTPSVWGSISGGSNDFHTYMDEVPDQITDYTANSEGIYVPTTLTGVKNLKNLNGSSTSAAFHAPYQLQKLTGGYSNALLGRASSADRVVGKTNHAKSYSDQTVGSLKAQDNVAYVRSNGTVTYLNGSSDWVVFQNQSTAKVDKLEGHVVLLRSWQGSNPTVDIARGITISGFTNGSNSNIPNIKDYTGLYIGDIQGGTGSNYSIYTKKGNIRFGDLAGSGERLVTADNDGVLAKSDKTLADLESLWKKESSGGRIVLKENSAGVARVSTSGSADRNDVTIDDKGKITARGFVGYNGATIFPDYVFEKYYTGESTIKADYNFHNLASVEKFIKTNGHLPGYTSAKEIAEKGLIDISATQLTNVEKIEELYLHTIEQE